MTNLAVREVEEGVLFTAKIVPGSKTQTRICGLLDEALKIKVSAAPEKGKANKHLVEFLAEQLGVKKKDVSIISGETTTIKQIQVRGISVDMLLRGLGL